MVLQNGKNSLKKAAVLSFYLTEIDIFKQRPYLAQYNYSLHSFYLPLSKTKPKMKMVSDTIGRSISFELTYSTSKKISSDSSKTSKRRNDETLDRLFYDCNKVRAIQTEGKQRREAIARASATKRQVPEYTKSRTMPISQAADFYKRSLNMKFEKERRLREKKKDAAEEKEKGIPKPKTIPISRACDFYERSRKMAFALEERKRAF
jgi:hypothetical protein